MTKTNRAKLMVAWRARAKLRAEGDKLWADGAKLWAECAKLWAEGEKLWAEGDKLWAEQILERGGNIIIEWHCIDGEKKECVVDGETFSPIRTRKDNHEHRQTS